MGRMACIEPQCMYKGDLYLYFQEKILAMEKKTVLSQCTFTYTIIRCTNTLLCSSDTLFDNAILTCSVTLTLRLLMSYIYIYMEHLFLMFLNHTQRRTTVGRTPLDE